VLAQFFTKRGLGAEATLEGDEATSAWPLRSSGRPTTGGLRNLFMADKGALNLRGANPMAGNIQDIIDAAHNPEIAVFVLPAAITGEVAALDLAPIRIFVALRIAPEAAQHAGPGFAKDEFAAGSFAERPGLFSSTTFGTMPEEWKRGGTRFGRRRARAKE